MNDKQAAWREYYEKNKEHLKARAREHYHANKDKKTPAEKQRKKRYHSTYYEANKEKWEKSRKNRSKKINEDKRKKYKEDEKTREYYKKQAKKHREENPEFQLRYDLKRKYGMTLEQYREILALQDGKCAICMTAIVSQVKASRLYVDHDHGTDKIRGLLCNNCNFAIGHLDDNPELCIRAAEYLIKGDCGVAL